MKVHVKVLLVLAFVFLNILNADNIKQGIQELKNNNEFEAGRFFRAANKTNELKSVLSTWEKGCKNDNFENCHYLGFVYTFGIGVALDERIGHAFFKKACENDILQSCILAGFHQKDNTLGYCDNLNTGLRFYQKACDGGNDLGCFWIGTRYEDGGCIQQDYEKALEYYKKDHSERGKIKYTKLIPKTELFGIKLRTATRDDIRKAILDTKAVIISQDKNKWGDVYDAGKILSDASELTIGYTLDDKFAYARYAFPSNKVDVQFASKIINIINSKYGNPSATYGNTIGTFGVYTYEWEQDDKIKITVSRKGIREDLYLIYTHPVNNWLMIEEQKKQKEQKETELYKSQGNAF